MQRVLVAGKWRRDGVCHEFHDFSGLPFRHWQIKRDHMAQRPRVGPILQHHQLRERGDELHPRGTEEDDRSKCECRLSHVWKMHAAAMLYSVLQVDV